MEDGIPGCPWRGGCDITWRRCPSPQRPLRPSRPYTKRPHRSSALESGPSWLESQRRSTPHFLGKEVTETVTAHCGQSHPGCPVTLVIAAPGAAKVEKLGRWVPHQPSRGRLPITHARRWSSSSFPFLAGAARRPRLHSSINTSHLFYVLG